MYCSVYISSFFSLYPSVRRRRRRTIQSYIYTASIYPLLHTLSHVGSLRDTRTVTCAPIPPTSRPALVSTAIYRTVRVGSYVRRQQ